MGPQFVEYLMRMARRYVRWDHLRFALAGSAQKQQQDNEKCGRQIRAI